MALNILNMPVLMCHSDNYIPVEIEAGIDWQNPTPAQDWGYWILFSVDTVTAGESISITIAGVVYEIVMLATGATIPDTGLGVEENAAPLAIETWLNTIFIPTVNQNYAIANNITFTAAPGILFINAPYESFMAVSTTIVGATCALTANGVAEIYPPNYHILLDLYIDAAKKATLKAIPEKASPYAAKFDLHEIVKTYVSSEQPPFGLTTLHQCTKTMCVIDFKFTEGWGNPVQYKGVSDNSTPLFALKGGVPFEDFKTLGITAPLYLNARRSSSPTTKIVSKNQAEYIYFFALFSLFDPTTSVEIYGGISYTDGTSTSVTWHTGVTLNNFTEYILPVGYAALNVGAYNPTKQVESWNVKIGGLEYGLMVDTQTYKLPLRDAPNELFFLFENSLNGFDTLRTTTNPSVAYQVSKEEFAKAINWTYNVEDGEKSNYNLRATKRIKASTGWVSLECIKYLQEFITSARIYEIGATYYRPVQLIGNSFQLYKAEEMLYSLEFEFEYMFEVNKYLAQ